MKQKLKIALKRFGIVFVAVLVAGTIINLLFFTSKWDLLLNPISSIFSKFIIFLALIIGSIAGIFKYRNKK